MASSTTDETRSSDEEKALLSEEHQEHTSTDTIPRNAKLWLSIAVNVIATVAIVRSSTDYHALY